MERMESRCQQNGGVGDGHGFSAPPLYIEWADLLSRWINSDEERGCQQNGGVGERGGENPRAIRR